MWKKVKSLFKRRRWLWLVVIVTLVWLIFGRGEKPVVVELAAVGPKTIARTVSASGELKAPSANRVYAPLAGQIQSVVTEEGQLVKRGQLLFIYSSEALTAALKSAESTLLKAQQAREVVLESALGDLDLKSQQASVDQTRAARDVAQYNYDQDQTETNKATLNAAITAHNQTLAAYQAALEANPNALDLNSADTAVAAAEAALAQARVNYNQRGVVAPNDGTVALERDTLGQIIAVPGKVTMQGQLVATVVVPERLRFEAEVDGNDVATLSVSQIAELELDAYSGKTYTASVAYIAGQSTINSSGSAVYVVTVAINNPEATFRAGLTGQTAFLLETAEDVLSVPATAVLIREDKNIVYVVSNGKAKRREIETGVQSATDVQVTSGLSAGEQVVISSNTRDLIDGQAIVQQ